MAKMLIFININYDKGHSAGEMETKENYEQPQYSISAAAKILSISVHTLRMYEREGLIIPFKKISSHRLYSQLDIDRLWCIRKAINEHKISINGIKTIYSFIPCWQISNCSNHDKKNCQAYLEHSQPCWNYKHKNNLCETRECRNCTVYKDFTECKSIKEFLVRIIPNNETITNQ